MSNELDECYSVESMEYDDYEDVEENIITDNEDEDGSDSGTEAVFEDEEISSSNCENHLPVIQVGPIERRQRERMDWTPSVADAIAGGGGEAASAGDVCGGSDHGPPAGLPPPLAQPLQVEQGGGAWEVPRCLLPVAILIPNSNNPNDKFSQRKIPNTKNYRFFHRFS